MAERAHRLRSEFCVQVTGEVVLRPEGNENPELATGAIEVTVTGLVVLSESAPLPFPVDEHGEAGEEIRLKHRYLDLRRSGPAAAMRLRSAVNRVASEVLYAREFVEIETPTLTRSTPEGARDFLVPGPPAPRLLVRPAAEPPAVQAAAHGRRDGALLPDRPLLPRRGLPRRPPARVHPARHRDELRRAGRRHRAGRGGPRRAVGAGRVRDPAPDPADDLRRGDGPLRHRQARPALRDRAHRPHRLLRRHAVPRVPEPLRRRGGHGGRREPGPASARRLAGVGQAARRPRAGLRAGRRGRHARRARTGRQEPLRGRAGRPRRHRRRPAGRLHLLRRRHPERGPRAARRRPRRDRPAHRRAGRVGVVVRLGRRRADVRGRRRHRRRRRRARPVDRAAPRVHLAQRRLDRQVRRGPRQRARLRVRHRLQRQRDRRRVDPYPPRRRPEAGLRGDGRSGRRRRRRSSASCSTPSPTVRLRTAASRSAGTGSRPSWRARTTSARSSPSRRPAAATTPSPPRPPRSRRSSARRRASTQRLPQSLSQSLPRSPLPSPRRSPCCICGSSRPPG